MSKTMRQLIIVVVLIGAVQSISSIPALAEEPMGFAEFLWGTPRTQLAEVCRRYSHGYDASLVPNSTDISCASRPVETAGDSFHPRLMFTAVGGLGGYQINSSSYSSLRDIVVAKFGLPHARQEKTYRTGTGREVGGEVLMWQWPSGTEASLSELCGKLHLSCVLVMSKRYGAELLESARERQEKGKGQF
jgi:hypothetical protein